MLTAQSELASCNEVSVFALLYYSQHSEALWGSIIPEFPTILATQSLFLISTLPRAIADVVSTLVSPVISHSTNDSTHPGLIYV